MSFGKDNSGLGDAGSFRQMGEAISARPKRAAGGGGGSFIFKDRYRPSMIGADTVRLLRGSYNVTYVPLDAEGNPMTTDAAGRPGTVTTVQPFYKTREHFYKRTGQFCTCSAGPLVDFRKFRDPCLGCEEFWGGISRNKEAGTKGRGGMSMSDQYVMSVLHYAHYHDAPQEDKDGKIKMNRDNTAPYTEWVPCNATYGMPCKHCRANDAAAQAGKPPMKMKLGHVGHWPLGFAHWNVLMSLQEQVGASCLTCSGANTIASQAWVCQNPACGNAIIDLSTTELEPKDIKKRTTGNVTCAYCGHKGFLEEIIGCSTCSKPNRATLFDVDINVMRVKQGQGEQETTVLQCSNWSAPRPIDPRFAELAIPLNLEAIYAPTALDVQSKKFQLPLPAGAASAPPPMTADGATRSYGPVGLYKQ